MIWLSKWLFSELKLLKFITSSWMRFDISINASIFLMNLMSFIQTRYIDMSILVVRKYIELLLVFLLLLRIASGQCPMCQSYSATLHPSWQIDAIVRFQPDIVSKVKEETKIMIKKFPSKNINNFPWDIYSIIKL